MTTIDPVSLQQGVSILRRTLLFAPLGVVGSARWFGSPMVGDCRNTGTLPDDPFSPLTFDEFGRQWQRLAEQFLPQAASRDETYAGQLAALIARLPLEQLPKLEQGRGGDGKLAGPTWFLAPVVIVEFQLDAGVELRLHNHPPQVVVTAGVEGECTYRHFEIDGEAPDCASGSKTPFRVRLSREGLLSPGRTTSLTRLRDGIHGFVAGRKKVRIVDFTVSLSDSEAFSYVQVESTPRDAEARCYDAVWTGK